MNDLTFHDYELLKYAIDNGMIDPALVQEKIDMQKRHYFLQKHTYNIWQGNNGKWYTYLPDSQKGRVLKKRNSQKEIENVVIEYYKNLEEIPTLEKVFNEWINGKLEYGEIQRQTYDRYKTDFTRFFEPIAEMDIRSIEELELEEIIKGTIRKQSLTNKAYAGLRTIVMGMFKYAKKKGYTSISISHFFGDIELSRKAFRKNIKKDEESVFTDSEVEKIFAYISENISIINLGIGLAFQTGLRVGELSALKSSDIKGNIIQVNKTEIRYKGDDGKYVFEVRENAKTDAGNRNVLLSSEALNTIKKIKSLNPFGEYLFMQDGKRLKEKAFSVKISKICRYVGIMERSMHKARKTYATKLINANVDERIIINQMGHTDISCTKNFYYFNNKNMEDALKQIESAVSY